MGSYGRNLEFRIVPQSENRPGRFSVPKTGTQIAIGAPIMTNEGAGKDDAGRQIVQLATAAAAPLKGEMGMLVFEYAPAAFAGFDQYLTTYSDLDKAPLGAAVQMVSGPNVKVVLRNTPEISFYSARTYAAKTMVAGLTEDQGTTPSTVVVGDYLTPGVGNDADGYWAIGTAANGWLVVTNVDDARGELEAHFRF